MKGETPRRTRGSLIGMVNDREFGVSFLEVNVTDDPKEGSSTLHAHMDNIPPSVGEWWQRAARGSMSRVQRDVIVCCESQIYKQKNRVSHLFKSHSMYSIETIRLQNNKLYRSNKRFLFKKYRIIHF